MSKSKVAIVTDSTAYLPDDIIKKYNIHVTPQVLIWGEETLRDGIDILPDAFYTRLSTAKVMPTTSQVSIVDMKNIFEKLVSEDHDVLGVFISSRLSGTIQSAQQGREMLPKMKDRIQVVDSLATSMALGFQVLSAARAAQDGASLADCTALAEKSKSHTGVLFVVDTLEFLHRGGRIGGAAKFLGTAINLKPILELQDGKIESIDKVRTKGKAYDRVLDLLEERVHGRTPIHLGCLHANAAVDARVLLDRAAERLHPVETIFTSVSPVIGAHAGPGTVGLAFQAGM